MNRADSATQADDLPGFLDEGNDRTKDETTTATASEELEAGDDGADTFPGIDTTAEDTGADAEAAPAAPAKRRRATPRTAGGGGLLTTVGVILILGAIAVGFAGEAAGSWVPNLARFGLSPASMVLAGIVLAGLGSTRSRMNSMQSRLDEASGSGTDLQATLQSLIVSHQATAEGTAVSGGESQQQLLVTLQRQDEKIGNLTKALKMYGKPIMEIAAQGTELAAGMAQAKAAADATLEASKQSWTRLETALRTGITKQTVDALQEEVRKVATAVEAVAKRPAQTVSFEPLQQQMTRTEVAVQAVSQRLEDTEVRKSLMRLEDAAGKAREAVQQLLKGESIEKATASLRERLDQATSKLHDGLEKIRNGSLGGLETSVREIQREIASVATRCSQIQAMVKSAPAGGGGSNSSSSRATAPATVAAPAAVAAQVAAGSGTPTPAAATTAATAATAPPPPSAGAAPAADAPAGGYQTGTRTSNSKNVLGAIAKLKQMKG